MMTLLNFTGVIILLLVNVCGPASFESFRTVGDLLCVTYREACQRLQNDTHWHTTHANSIFTAPAIKFIPSLRSSSRHAFHQM